MLCFMNTADPLSLHRSDIDISDFLMLGNLYTILAFSDN